MTPGILIAVTAVATVAFLCIGGVPGEIGRWVAGLVRKQVRP